MADNMYEECYICNKPITEWQRALSLGLYDESLENGSLKIYNSWNLVSYHKKCSPVKINKRIFERGENEQ